MGLIARLMCTRGANIKEDDEMIDEISLDETSWDEMIENKVPKTKLGFQFSEF